ncbi:MAG: hypothetical protein ACAI43_21725 [Phycisphaerae bacterium]|nr:hypothetical protein [Tepidisphaeraceae bacterium]
MNWIAEMSLADMPKWVVVLIACYAAGMAIAFVAMFVGLCRSAKPGETYEGEGMMWVMIFLSLFWPAWVYGSVRARVVGGATSPAKKKKAGSGTLGAPASGGGAADDARAAAAVVVEATPGQRCARCGSVIRDVARKWGTGAVCGGCASDLGVSG